MSAVEETIANESSTRRLTFRQKFWLLGVGLPVLLMVVLLVVAMFLPKPLNPTEEKLLGTWEAVFPANTAGLVVEFREGDAVSGSEPWFWKANGSQLSTTDMGSHAILRRIQLAIGLTLYDEWRIEALNEDELRIRHTTLGGDPLIFKRIESAKN